METHYLPKFTKAGPDGRQRAACGAYVHHLGHSVEPSCASCRAYLNSGPRPETSVAVVKVTPLPLLGITQDSAATYQNATADQFELDVLTITSLTDGAVVETFAPDRWRSASVISADGHTAFAFENKSMQRDTAWQGHQESRQRRSA